MDGLLTAQGDTLWLDSEALLEADKTTTAITGEDGEFQMMVLYADTILTFDANWKTPTKLDNTYVTYTNVTYPAGVYARTIKNVTVTDGKIALLKS